MKKYTLFAVAMLALFFTVQRPAHAQDFPLKIAVVDFVRIDRESEAALSIQTQMKEISQGLQTKFTQSESDLRQAQQDLLNKQALLTPDAFQEERRKFEQRVIQSKQAVQKQNQVLQRAHIRAQDQAKRKMTEILLKYASDNGYTLVLKRSQTAIVADQYDITNQIIAELNRQLPTVKVQLGQ